MGTSRYNKTLLAVFLVVAVPLAIVLLHLSQPSQAPTTTTVEIPAQTPTYTTALPEQVKEETVTETPHTSSEVTPPYSTAVETPTPSEGGGYLWK